MANVLDEPCLVVAIAAAIVARKKQRSHPLAWITPRNHNESQMRGRCAIRRCTGGAIVYTALTALVIRQATNQAAEDEP
jgi:hypothetical protein